ncbi:MAG: AAA family ATPase [Deltaproteobacteria bacterium]|nr:AAA family ATPase [Deltaproteobacteria bacterium]
MYESYFGLREAAFTLAPDPRFYYTNSLYEEAYATLRYGIEAKKGVAVITGEPGTGKTTLLRILMRNLEVTVHAVFPFYPCLSFTELLRPTLWNLGLAKQDENRLTTMTEFKDYLADQHKNAHIVALLIDEAQNLSDQALEGIRLLSNLETDKEKLVQIVLMGQPELQRRLDRPRLRQLKQRVAAQCRLVPLEHTEVGRYIDFRLHTAGYGREKLFQSDAVERIAFYSKGIPRVINTICDNALLIAYASSKREVTAAMIEEVAGDLRLKEPTQAATKNLATELLQAKASAKVSKSVEDAAVADDLWEVGLDGRAGMGREPARTYPRGSGGTGIGIFLALFLLGSAGAALYSEQAGNYLAGLGVNLEGVFAAWEQHLGLADRAPGAVEEKTAEEAPRPETPPPQDYSSLTQNDSRDISSPPELKEPSGPEAAAPPEEKPAPRSANKPPDNIKQAFKVRPRPQALNDPEIKKRLTEIQIYKAIRNRAITGVEVSLINGTAYLDGRVETERQKSAAERAARSIPAVREVRNRIVVNSAPSPEEMERIGLTR